MKPHAFVLMPFGKKTDRNQVTIDYDSVYRDLITPALAAAGLCVIRPTQEQAVGEIMSHWLQELLSADLVVADLSLDNFDIGYLLGIRQALRATGVILLNAYQLSDTPAFEYQLNYTINNRVVDAASLTRDIHALTALVELTKVANPTKPSSPIFQHIPQLAEPDWNIARVASAASFWQAHADWEVDRQTAEQCGNLNDLLRLAKATPVAQFRAEALIQTGIALCAVNNVELALQQFEQALDIVPNHLRGLQEKGHCLLQLALQEKAGQPLYAVRLHYISLLKDYPDDPVTWVLLGNIDKEVWIKTWHKQAFNTEQMRSIAAEGEARLRSAIESYRQAFRRNPGHYVSGIQALTLMRVYQYLTGETRYFVEAKAMLGAVQYAVEYEPKASYECKATLGDLEILIGTPASVCNAYKTAIAQAPTDPHKLNATLYRLYLLQKLGFHLENVTTGIATFEKALAI